MLRTRLRSRPNTVVTSVPFHVDESGDITGGTAEVLADADSLADEADTVDS